MFFSVALTVGMWGVVGWGRKFYLGPAEIASFSSRDLSRGNKHDTFWHVASTRCFYVLFLWAIAASHFLPLEIYKTWGLLLSSITFTVNSHADNHFYKHFYLFQNIQYEIRFFIKIDVKGFYIQIWFKCETLLLFFYNKTHSLLKKTLYK